MIKRIHEDTANNSDWNYGNLPDLLALQEEIKEEPDAAEHSSKLTNGDAALAADKPLYYAVSLIDGVTSKVYATEEEAFKGGQDWDLNPVVYYRVKKPVEGLGVLPAIDIAKLYERETDDSLVSFVFKQQVINFKEIDKIEVSDENVNKMLKQVLNFTTD